MRRSMRDEEGQDLSENLQKGLVWRNRSPLTQLSLYNPYTMSSVHTLAQEGFATGTNELYDRSACPSLYCHHELKIFLVVLVPATNRLPSSIYSSP